MTTFENDQQGASAGRVMARESARKRFEAKRGFVSDVVAYVVVNAFLIGVWAFTGAGYFWPVGPRRLGGCPGVARMGRVRAPTDHGGRHR